MSRTSSFRNACCLQERESTTNRAKSQTSCSSERHFNTRDARSDEIVKRLRCFKGLNSTLLGDARNASWNRCLGVLHVGQSKIACHSESQNFRRLVFQQNRQASFTSESRRPGNAFQRDLCLSRRAPAPGPGEAEALSWARSCNLRSKELRFQGIGTPVKAPPGGGSNRSRSLTRVHSTTHQQERDG